MAQRKPEIAPGGLLLRLSHVNAHSITLSRHGDRRCRRACTDSLHAECLRRELHYATGRESMAMAGECYEGGGRARSIIDSRAAVICGLRHTDVCTGITAGCCRWYGEGNGEGKERERGGRVDCEERSNMLSLV
ncbi:hypothetical protein MRX96_020985 [Rhipicephalus microplus]